MEKKIYKWEKDRLVQIDRPLVQWEVKRIAWLEGHATFRRGDLDNIGKGGKKE